MKKIRDNKEFARNPQAVIKASTLERKKCEMLDSAIKPTVIIMHIKSSHRRESCYADK
jgi:hypothetical protein|nr:MAG TPA: hypothetical protein [Caudoviricetes sp.]